MPQKFKWCIGLLETHWVGHSCMDRADSPAGNAIPKDSMAVLSRLVIPIVKTTTFGLEGLTVPCAHVWQVCLFTGQVSMAALLHQRDT